MTGHPLVALEEDQPSAVPAGVRIAEDIGLGASGNRNTGWAERALGAGLRHLRGSGRPGERFDGLIRLLRWPPGPPPDAVAEQRRVQELGFDPAVGHFRASEAETALRIEGELGVMLTRAPPGSTADWVDESGRTYDAVGNFPSRYFDRQWPQFRYQIERHLTKADIVPVDVSQFTPQQVARVGRFLAARGLGPRVFMVGQ